MLRRPVVAMLPAAALAGVAGLHAAWGLGSSFPMPDRVSLADTVAGLDVMPPAGACFVVAGSLTAVAAVVAGFGGSQRWARWARGAVAAGLLVRGITGTGGVTAVLVPWTPSAHFRRLDRRRYGPICLALAGAIALATATD